MAITLVTGLPGHGKTLWTLWRYRKQAADENRPVFHNDIPGLNIDGWAAHDAEKWYDLPANSYMVIDEAWRVFPVRARSAVMPKHVEDLAVHRHAGIDIVIVTQHPMLVDTAVRKLVDRHFHVVRMFGLARATVYEFPSGVQDSPEKNKRKDGVVRHEWSYPKDVFSLYKSAELHTGKRRVPLRVWLTLGTILLVPVLFWLVYMRLWVQHGGAKGPEAAASAPGQVAAAATPSRYAAPPRLVDAMSAGQYLATFKPRIVGLPFTAPAYDQLTKPVEAPYPSVCAYGDDFPCRCWSQRGFSLKVPRPLCEQLAREPMDPYWLKRGSAGYQNGDGMVTPVDEQRKPRPPADVPTGLPLPAQAVAQVAQ